MHGVCNTLSLSAFNYLIQCLNCWGDWGVEPPQLIFEPPQSSRFSTPRGGRIAWGAGGVEPPRSRRSRLKGWLTPPVFPEQFKHWVRAQNPRGRGQNPRGRGRSQDPRGRGHKILASRGLEAEARPRGLTSLPSDLAHVLKLISSAINRSPWLGNRCSRSV